MIAALDPACEPFAALIRAHVPEVPLRRMAPLPHSGWGGESDAFVVDDALVFRFPRSLDARRALAVEARLLPLIAPRVPLPVPAFRYVVAGDGGLPRFSGYPLLPGAPLTPDRFPALVAHPPALEEAARLLGGFLGGLHTTPRQEALAAGVAAPATGVRRAVELAHQRARALTYTALDPPERAYIERLYARLLDDPRHFGWPQALCHGDLSTDHIIARSGPGQAPRLTGIIDFGDAGFGDPAGDFVWRFELGPPSGTPSGAPADDPDDTGAERFFQRVLAHYRAPLPDPAALMRVVECRYRLMPVTQIAWALETGSAPDVAEGRARLRAGMATLT